RKLPRCSQPANASILAERGSQRGRVNLPFNLRQALVLTLRSAVYGILKTLDELLQMGNPRPQFGDLLAQPLLPTAGRRRRCRFVPGRVAGLVADAVQDARRPAAHRDIPAVTSALVIGRLRCCRGSRGSAGVNADSHDGRDGPSV